MPDTIAEIGRKHNTSIAYIAHWLTRGQGMEMQTIDDAAEAKAVAHANIDKQADYYQERSA